MVKSFQLLFTWPVAILVGIGTVGVLVLLILGEESVQPFSEHRWAKEMVTPALADGVVYRQEVEIPEGLANGQFLMGLFFGSQKQSSPGSIEVTLTQESHAQSHIVTGLSPMPTLRKRFRFDGFDAGPAVVEIRGMSGNSESAPGLLGITELDGANLAGPGLEHSLTASIDWFKILEGERKLSLSFPNSFVSLLWLLPFAGLLALAWRAMKPLTVE